MWLRSRLPCWAGGWGYLLVLNRSVGLGDKEAGLSPVLFLDRRRGTLGCRGNGVARFCWHGLVPLSYARDKYVITRLGSWLTYLLSWWSRSSNTTCDKLCWEGATVACSMGLGPGLFSTLPSAGLSRHHVVIVGGWGGGGGGLPAVGGHAISQRTMFVVCGPQSLGGFGGGGWTLTFGLVANAPNEAVLVLESTHACSTRARWYGSRVHSNVALLARGVGVGLTKEVPLVIAWSAAERPLGLFHGCAPGAFFGVAGRGFCPCRTKLTIRASCRPPGGGTVRV